MVILSVGLLALGRFQGKVMQASAQSKARTEALRLVQDKIEQWHGFSTLAQFDLYANGSDAITGSQAVFTRNWVVTETLLPVYKSLQITVDWQDRSGHHSVVLNTVLGKADPMASGKVLFALANPS